MNAPFPRLMPLLLAVMFFTTGANAAQVPNTLLHSLFDPSTNAQTTARQGYSVAVDGNYAVIGVPFDEVGTHDAGTVKVYDATTGALLHMLVNPNPSAGEFFGWAVAISGTRVVVGANSDKGGSNIMGSAVGGAYIYELAGATPTIPAFTLTNPTPASSDLFGHAVAISGTRVVIGAPGDDINGADAGIAYAYDLDGATPVVPQFVFNNPSPAANEGFGVAVAVSGTRVVVATPWDGTGAAFAGSAYVYDLAGATPSVPATTLNNPSPAANDQFGYAVSVFGKWVVVGANQDDVGTTDAGSAYVYDLTLSTPNVPVLILNNPFPAMGDHFGFSVAVSGTHVLVGAVYDDTGATNAGSAYVFDLAGTLPTVPVRILNNPSPAVGDNFGNAVAISGTRLVVGAPYDDIAATDSGSAYLYDFAGATPAAPTAILAQPSPAFGDFFGRAVAISGTRVVVGADGDDTGATEAGRVYIYDLASFTPSAPIFTLNNPAPTDGDLFGWSVDISGTRVIVGTLRKDFPTNNAGVVFVYDLAHLTPTIPIFAITNPTPAVDDQFGAAVAIDGTRVIVGALFDDTGAINAGSAYVYELAGIGPRFPIVTLTNPAPAMNDQFGHSVAISGTRVVVGAYRDDTGGTDVGSAYVYDLVSVSRTTPVAVLNNSSFYREFSYFGHSVGIAGNTLVVGCYRDDVLGVTDSGIVYVYDLGSATPTVPAITLMNPDPGNFDYFGWDVAISGTRVVVGATLDFTGVTAGGGAYLYDLATAIPTVPIASLFNPSPAADDRFGLSVAVDGTTIVASAPYDDTLAEDRGAVYIFGLRPTLSLLPASPGYATISWTPSASSGFVLQYADSLSPTNWFNAPSGAANPVTIPTTNASRFYRLSQP